MADETTLIKFFGGSPFIRILDALIDNIGGDYSKKEIQNLAGVSKGALFQHWPKLEELGLVKSTRSFGNTRLFTLNRESPVVKELLRLEARMVEETAPKKAVAVAGRRL
ncbi:MAG: winged helix-turn-helix domain-containing protein [Candidatus Diapherotrites archaeon]|nr:winged helix-turn-helix domain-containing protein [Candidatus Diapherotrites archaeon]